MKHDAADIVKEALALPPKDRATLAEALLASFDGHVDEDSETAWATEIERRVTELFARAWISSGRLWVPETISTAGRTIPSRTIRA